MEYAVFEGNMDRLEKKLIRIRNKCRVYGCTFHYRVTGETFKELVDEHGIKYMARFILVEAEGTARANGWEFAASVEHTENGNIFSGVQGIQIPERYYRAKPVCEHCNTDRYRKYTYIVRNMQTGEFKQVGKACLKDFTRGLSAEEVAQYLSLFDMLTEGETPYPGVHMEHYILKEEYLAYVAETVRHFGYVNVNAAREKGNQTTASRAFDYYNADRGHAGSREYLEQLRREMEHVGFDRERPETMQQVADALAWIAAEPEGNNYIHNLKTVCSLEYVPVKNIALLASLIAAYGRGRKRKAGQDEEHGKGIVSRHIGDIGGKTTIRVRAVRCMTSYETQYGTRRIYEITDTGGNIFVWKTGCLIEGKPDGMLITGTVKGHNEFGGVKQTELIRCRVTAE